MSRCPRCRLNPAAHTMFELGHIDQVPVIYNAPVKAIEVKETPESLNYFISHVEYLEGGPWILLVDCKGMKLRNSYSIGLMKQIIHYLNINHENYLQKIILLNPNAWMRAFLTVIRPFLRKTLSQKLKVLKTEMEVYAELSSFGSAAGIIAALRNQAIPVVEGGEEEE